MPSGSALFASSCAFRCARMFPPASLAVAMRPSASHWASWAESLLPTGVLAMEGRTSMIKSRSCHKHFEPLVQDRHSLRLVDHRPHRSKRTYISLANGLDLPVKGNFQRRHQEGWEPVSSHPVYERSSPRSMLADLLAWHAVKPFRRHWMQTCVETLTSANLPSSCSLANIRPLRPSTNF